MDIDLKKEHQASKERPRYSYSWAARLFFLSMDLITGRKTTLAKAKLIEMLASIPYRSWEIRQYGRMTRGYRDRELVREARNIMNWGREAQDNEFWHLQIINEKMKEDGIKDPWYLFSPIPLFCGWRLCCIHTRDGIDKHSESVPVQCRIRGPCRTRVPAICRRSSRMGRAASQY